MAGFKVGKLQFYSKNAVYGQFLAKKSGQMASFEKKSGQKKWAFLVNFGSKMDKNRPKIGILTSFSCHFEHFSMIFEFCGQKPTFIFN